MKHQIATDPSQSARLTACGMDPKSADMVLTRLGNVLQATDDFPIDRAKETPVWSLPALLYALKGLRILVAYQPDTKEWQALSGRPAVVYGAYSDNPIESCVKLIERLTSEGYKLNEI